RMWCCRASRFALAGALAATSAGAEHLWRAPLAMSATTLPPLGIIGLASPLTAAGYLFPGTAWIGLAAVAFLPGVILATSRLPMRHRRVVWCSIAAACLTLGTVPRLFGSTDAAAP